MMKRYLVCAVVPVLALGLLLGEFSEAEPDRTDTSPAERERPADIAAPQTTPSSVPQAGLRLLRTDETGIVLELHTPGFQDESLDDVGCERLSVDGYATTDEAGWPQVPVRGAMVGVPTGAEVSLTVLESEGATLPGRYDLCPAPQPVLRRSPSGDVYFGGETVEYDEDAYASPEFYPASLAEIVSTGFLRSQRVAQLRLHPFQVNPVTGQVRHVRRIRARIDFNSPVGALASDDTAAEDEKSPFEETLRQTLVNYESAQSWRVRPRSTAPASRVSSTDQDRPAYKVEVDQVGVYEIAHSDLEAAGADVVNLDPRTFRLHSQEEEVAIHVVGETDGSFDPGDHILFYGQRMNTRYTDVNVYWLTWGASDGKRMPALDGAPDEMVTVPGHFRNSGRLEEDHNYQAALPSGPDDDRWYWSFIWATAPTVASYTTTLKHIATAPLSATVRGLFKGYDAVPEHHTRVYLNGHLIDDATWAPRAEHQFTVDVPQSYLLEGTNTISVEVPLDRGITGDYFVVNWFEIDYPDTHVAESDILPFGENDGGAWEYQVSRFTTDTLDVLDVTSPTAPVRVLGSTVEPVSDTFTLRFQDTITEERHYLALARSQRLSPLSIEEDAPSDLRSTANGADYVVVTHGDFVTDVVPLAEHRAAQGMRTQIVDVQDVYDEFNGGIFNPTAIHDFLAYAYANWAPPAPAYVVLVGDGNYDFKDNYGFGEPNYVPPYLVDADPWMGEVPADNRYVCVSGDDLLPDMHIGRLPVKTRVEAAAVVSKILGYEGDPPPGEWNRQVLFVADDADTSGDFAALSNSVADHFLPSPYTAQKVHHKVTHTTASESRAAIIDALNEGRLLVNYVGHAAQQFWAVEHLLDLSDIDTLTNTERLPLMAPMTCLEGHFAYPSLPDTDLSCLGESIVRAKEKGAIASWSPTGLGVSTGHNLLGKGLYEAIFFDGVHQVGPATTQAKLHMYANSGGYRELLDTYLLFGDPALHLNVLKTDVGISKTVDPPGAVHPGDRITYTLTYSNAGPATAHHVVVTDLLPSVLTSPRVSASGAETTPRPDTRFVWDVADLAAGDGGTITITAAMSSTVTGFVTNTATIATSALERTTRNNVASVKTDIIRHHVYLPLVTKHGETSLMD
jgi:uncharacterized repeat protein (TIGR01451 family)